MNQAAFYQVGGDLKFQHPSYISRQSDEELYQAIRNGDFCYVLNCRQMGKSSLAVQIFHRLKADGYACCFISLSDIGSDNVTPNSWYFTLAHKIVRKLRINFDISAWWEQQQLLSPIGKFSKFIEEILLTTIDRDIAIILDEVDCISRLAFGADDFLAAIRSCYNHRATRPEYQRLQFTLLGVATPSSLIKNLDCTPFNIGTAIVLQGFKLDEARLLATGLTNRTDRSEEIIAEILKWTGGQPFLTQKLCKIIAESTDIDLTQEPQRLVAQITRSSIIDNWTEQDNPQHLKTIQDRILNRKELTIKLLWLYKEVLAKREIRADSSAEQVELRLSGLVVDRDDNLEVFNLIYKQVFNSDWLLQQLSKFSIPYLEKINAWEKSNRQDKSQLLTKESLDNALEWAQNRNLSSIDWQYLKASETAIIIKEKDIITRQFKQIGLLFSSFAVGAAIFGSIFYQKYASCSIERGEVGEKIGDICFRSLRTSGEKIAVISSSNFYLKQGVDTFKRSEYLQARDLFQKAIEGDPTDPVAKIFFNNTKARIRGNPLKIAAVVPIDYYESAAIDILRGVADAQTEFNQKRAKNDRLVEVVIVNDGNKSEVAEKVSRELAEDREIVAIVGHHFSSSTKAALEQYESAKIAVVSPTSSSSELTKRANLKSPNKYVLFPTIPDTKYWSNLYTKYFIDRQLTKIAVIDFSNSNNKLNANKEYLEAFYNDFKQAFSQQDSGQLDRQIVNDRDVNKDSIEEIHKKYPQTQAILVISSGETNMATISLAQKNLKLNQQRFDRPKIELFATHAFADRDTLEQVDKLERIGKSWVDIKVICPCQNIQNKDYPYIKKAKIQWLQKNIYWRTGYGYDATRRIVKAIDSIESIDKLSANSIRQKILVNLGSVQLASNESSGFVLFSPKYSQQDRPCNEFEYRKLNLRDRYSDVSHFGK